MGASALALAVPFSPAVASQLTYVDFGITDSVIDKLEEIDRALDTAAFYRFDFPRTAMLLGVVPEHGAHDVKTLRSVLQKLVINIEHRDTIDRIRYVNAIRTKLDEQYGSEYMSAHILWMHRTGPVWNYSARQLLETGYLNDLRSVALMLDPSIA